MRCAQSTSVVVPEVDCFKGAKPGRDVKVLRAINGAKHAAHDAEVVIQEPIRSDGVHRGLPSMPVRIDHAWDRDHSLGVDNEGVGRVDLVIDGSDAIAVDKDIAWSKVALVVVHRDDIAAFDQDFSTFARAFLSRLGATRTEARETARLVVAANRRRNSGEKSAPVGPPWPMQAQGRGCAF